MPRLLAILLLSTRLFAAGRELAPRPLVPADPEHSLLYVVEAGGRFLTAWFELRGFYLPSPLMGAFTDARGARLGEPFVIDTFVSWSNTTFELVGTGNSFAIFSTDDDGVTTLVDLDGNGRVIRRRTLALEPHLWVRAAWNGSVFLATLAHPGTAPDTAVLLSRDGTVLKSGIVFSGHADEIVATPAQFLVVTAYPSLVVQTVANDGTFTTTTIGSWTRLLRAAALPNGGVLIVTAKLFDGGALRAYVLRNGAVAAAVPHLARAEVEPLGIVAGGDRHLVVFAVKEGTAWRVGTVFVGDDGAARGPAVATPLVIDDAYNALSHRGGVLVSAPSPKPGEGVIAVAVTQDGAAHGPSHLTIHPADQHPPVLAAGGGAFLAAWTEGIAGGTRIRAASLGFDGEPRGDREVLAAGALAGAELAWSGSEWLAVAQTPAGLRAVRIAADGAPAAGPVAELAPFEADHAAVAWAGDRWAVVWSSGSSFWFAEVSAGGVASAPRPLRLNSPALASGGAAWIYGLSLAFDGAHLHLTWLETALASNAFTTRLTASGTVIDEHALALLPGTTPQHVSSVAYDGRLAVLVDDSSRTLLATVDANRAVAARTLFDWRARSDLAWTGRELVAAVRAEGERWYVSLFRMAPDGSLTAAPRGIATLPPQHSPDPSVAVTPLQALAAVQEADMDGPRAMIYAERELPRLPDPPPPPRNVRIVRGENGGHDLVWDDTAELYLAETLHEDGHTTLSFFRRAPRFPNAVGTVRLRAFLNGVPSASTDWISITPRRRRVRR